MKLIYLWTWKEKRKNYSTVGKVQYVVLIENIEFLVLGQP